MLVETYEVTEATTEGRDQFEDAVAAQELIESLGLEGQATLLAAATDPEVSTKTIIPYRQMTREEIAVYKTLYPQSDKVESYRSGPMPLRVLQVIAHCRSAQMFKKLEVWGPQTHDPDPLLVGINVGPGLDDHYLLARWGDSLAPFEELRQKAEEMLVRKWTASAETVIQEAQAFIAAPLALVRKRLTGQWVYAPWI